jgi:hypothetical protein
MNKVHPWLARVAAANAKCTMFAAQWAADGMETAHCENLAYRKLKEFIFSSQYQNTRLFCGPTGRSWNVNQNIKQSSSQI